MISRRKLLLQRLSNASFSSTADTEHVYQGKRRVVCTGIGKKYPTQCVTHLLYSESRSLGGEEFLIFQTQLYLDELQVFSKHDTSKD